MRCAVGITDGDKVQSGSMHATVIVGRGCNDADNHESHGIPIIRMIMLRSMLSCVPQ